MFEGLLFRAKVAVSHLDLTGAQSWSTYLEVCDFPQRREQSCDCFGIWGEAPISVSRGSVDRFYLITLTRMRSFKPGRPSSPGVDAGVAGAHSLLSGPPAACATCSRPQARTGTAWPTWTRSCRSRSASSTSPTPWLLRPPSAASRWQVRPRKPASRAASYSLPLRPRAHKACRGICGKPGVELGSQGPVVCSPVP